MRLKSKMHCQGGGHTCYYRSNKIALQRGDGITSDGFLGCFSLAAQNSMAQWYS
jgi:hypothetical protein